MNIITYNVRGLGRGIKWPTIRRMVNKQHIDMLCIQETKKEIVDRSMCQALWGNTDVRWEAQAASNSAGGILCLWSEKSFKLQRKVIGQGFLLLVGEWLQEQQLIHIITIYSPCDIQNKRILWDNVKQLKYQSQGGLWCVLGDFNNIRASSERVGICHRGSGESNMSEFNEWIEELEVEEVPWLGRQFTWFRPNGTAKSKLDRFLVSPEWLAKWPGSTQHTLDRNFSDHCPILLRSKFVDWGPKPFRILDCWFSDNSFKKIVQESWSSNQQSGWGGYVLKEKIKSLKQKLKAWNKEQFGNTFKRYKKIEEELNKLETNTGDRHLTPNEMMTRKQLQEDLWRAAQSQESLLRQKARSKWIKEGDCNTRYFHLMMNASRRNNSLRGVWINGAWSEEPARVKEEVRSFFMQRFQEPDQHIPRLDSIIFHTIDNHQNEMLLSRFTEEEVKSAV